MAGHRRELVECEAEHGLHRDDLQDDVGLLSPKCFAVHATWLGDAQAQVLGDRGGQVVLCPTTERSLGDGLPGFARLRKAGVRLATGTDSHAPIDPFAGCGVWRTGSVGAPSAASACKTRTAMWARRSLPQGPSGVPAR